MIKIITRIVGAIHLTVILLTMAIALSFLEVRCHQRAIAEATDAPIQLTARILDQKYCKSALDFDQLRVELSLTFINRGSKELMLSKSSITNINKYSISRSREDAIQGRYELSPIFSRITASITEDKKQPLESLFIRLAPGASYVVETYDDGVIIPATNLESNSDTVALKPGVYFLMIQVNGSSLSEIFPDEIQAVRQNAVLWQGPVTSEPFPISIDERRTVEECSSYQRLLDESRTNPNVKGEDGITALLLTVTYSNEERFLELLDAGADPNAGTTAGIMPIMMAASRDGIFLEALLKYNADVNATSDRGETPLMSAVSRGLTQNARLLIQAGANVNARNKRGETALGLAKNLRDEERRAIFAILRSAGAIE